MLSVIKNHCSNSSSDILLVYFITLRLSDEYMFLMSYSTYIHGMSMTDNWGYAMSFSLVCVS